MPSWIPSHKKLNVDQDINRPNQLSSSVIVWVFTGGETGIVRVPDAPTEQHGARADPGLRRHRQSRAQSLRLLSGQHLHAVWRGAATLPQRPQL